MSRVKITGRFEDMTESGCPARWRVHSCPNLPTVWVVRWVEDDDDFNQRNTCLMRYCQVCWDARPAGHLKVPDHWSFDTDDQVLTDREAQDLLREAAVYEIQEG